MATRTLITVLVLLQLIAPLVHAHLGFDNSPPGIHVPGLEFVNAPAGDNDLQSATSNFTLDGLVVGIVTGVSHHDWIVIEPGNAVCMPVSDNLHSQERSCQGLGSSPPFRIAFPQTIRFPASPRAPPPFIQHDLNIEPLAAEETD
ncbi:MAG: hypothetical protein ABFS02_01690 [Pseudomonadota bacterium]